MQLWLIEEEDPRKEGLPHHEGRGHQGLLPKNTAYQFRASEPGVLVLQTCQGELSVEKWADICQTA